MTSTERGGRGGRGGGRGGRGGRGGGMDGGSIGRSGNGGGMGGGGGVWNRGPPPGSAFPHSHGGSPALGHAPGPRTSINDHMADLKVVVQEEKRRNFQTDTDISRSTGPTERELKPWTPDGIEHHGPSPGPSNGAPANGGKVNDFDTFGATKSIPWDQFETNERLFGAKTDFKEEMYTTKLNRTGADFKKREKDAERVAAEIMGQTAKNAHVAEERGQLDTRDEEEKYSGVSRAPNAYVPPGARRAMGGGAPAPRASGPPSGPAHRTNGSAAPSPSTAPAPVPSKTISPSPLAAAVPPPGPPRSTSDDPVATQPQAVPMKASGTRPITEGVEVLSQSQAQASSQGKAAPSIGVTAPPESKDQLGNVVDRFREFVGTEREKAEATKQSVLKSEREKQLAELKKFQANFKVPLPMPKDILPILAKDESKQKEIDAKAAAAYKSAAAQKEAAKSQAALAGQSSAKPSPARPSAPLDSAKAEPPKPQAKKVINMKIPEIPPFKSKPKDTSPAAGAVQPPSVPVPETASHNLHGLVGSPTPSQASLAQTAKLNPGASAFVFKPNPGATPFRPGGAAAASPAGTPRQAPAVAAAGSSTAGPAPASGTSPSPAQPPRNLFFQNKLPERIASINMRDDFNPWKHGPVPPSASVPPVWPYQGRKHQVPHQYLTSPQPPMHAVMPPFEEGPSSPSPLAQPPQLMGGVIPPNYPPYYRFQPGMPPPHPGNMQVPFSPQQYAPHPGQPMGQQPPQHIMQGGPQPNGMPMYFQNGIPQTPQFLPPQHMQQFAQHTPQRHGPGPGPGGPQMFYQGPIPHQSPIQHQHPLPYPGQQQQPPFQQPPPPMQISPGPGGPPGQQGGQFDGPH
ncbi:hypothetical protein IAT38_004174 [Cryptococcus sp. DSM 104549]